MTARSILQLFPLGLVAGLDGSIELVGEELVGASQERLADVRGSRAGMVFQDASAFLNPTMRIGKQILEQTSARRPSGRTRASQEEIDGLKKTLRSVGLPQDDRFLKMFPHELSGGMRQRVLLAMAIHARPDLLIADEPTTALDVTVQAQVLATIKQLTDQFDMALLLITHDLGVVAGMCDRVYVMYAGQVVESGPVSAVFDAPRHPYTSALLRSVLTTRMSQDEELVYIPGVVPSFSDMTSGCRFAARCSYATEACGESQALEALDDGRHVRCVRWEELELTGASNG